ncbi:hypothetical protein Ahy_B02g057842 isoform C [Arachis hypogaea]|uniref:Uncharacterized protein n=1 Tax=Arachis hypogaea TaxID=3818 RepID=A0A445AD18_ARAHY|nr:hypothetical protein Ahy_B02g057842 isoform C [Arachis hypogaea]
MSLNKNEREKEDLMVMNLAKAKRWRRCSKCRIYVEKNKECSHISCSHKMINNNNIILDKNLRQLPLEENLTRLGNISLGIYRMKYHLAKIPGQIKVCSKVTEEVELQFKRILMEKK